MFIQNTLYYVYLQLEMLLLYVEININHINIKCHKSIIILC